MIRVTSERPIQPWIKAREMEHILLIKLTPKALSQGN